MEIATGGHLYQVKLDVEESQLLDWDAPLSEQPEILAMLRSTDWWKYAEDALDRGNDNPTGRDLHRWLSEGSEAHEVSGTLAGAGIRGIRYLDGNSRNRGEGTRNFVIFDAADIEILEENGQPVQLAAPSFAIARADSPLLSAIEALAVPPDTKAGIYKRMRGKVADVRRRFDERRMKSSLFDLLNEEDPTARFELMRDIATLEAIAKTLPPAIRGKLVGSFRKVENLKTAKGREAYLLQLLPKIEAALESHLVGQFRQAIRREFDRGAVKVSQSKTRGGKIGAAAHAIFAEARRSMKLKPAEAEASAAELRNEIETAETLSGDQLEELDGRIAALDLFHDYENADSARLEEALKLLRDVYGEGRKQWLQTLAARRALRESRVSIFRKGLNLDRPVDYSERTSSKRRGEKLLTSLGEGFMEYMLSNSQKLRRLAERSDDPAVIAAVESMEDAFLEAEIREVEMNRTDNEALAHAMRTIFGVSTEYGVAKKLRELTRADGEAAVTKVEGFKKVSIHVPKNVVESILRGETAGFTTEKGERIELSPQDVAALDQAWENFTKLDEAQQNRRRIVAIERQVSAGARRPLGELNQLEGLQIYLTMRQPDQATKLDAMGFDATTLAELEAWLKPEVKALGAWMVDYLKADQGAIDALHRAEKGVGLGLVENYFPVRNDVARVQDGDLSLDGQAQQQGGRSVGFIKERVTNRAKPAIVNALAVFLAHRSQANFWKSHVSPLREWGGVIRDERFAEAVKTRMGDTYYQSLTRTLERIEGGGRPNASALAKYERVLKGMLKNFALGTLGMRMSTIMVNATAAMNVAFEVPAPVLVKGMLKVLKRPEAFRDAWNSPALRRRLEEGATFEARVAKASGPSNRPIFAVLNSAAEKGMFPINLVDTSANLIGAAVVWEHTRGEALRAGVDPDTAKELADAKVEKVLLRSAQPTLRLARSEFEQRVLDHPLSAFLALFISEPRKNLAITYMAVRELVTGKGTYSKAQAAQQAFVGLVAYIAAEHVVRSLYAAFVKAEDDDEDGVFDRWWNRMTDGKAWSYLLATSQLRGIPIFGPAWEAAMGRTFDQPVFDRSPNPLVKVPAAAMKIDDVFDGTTEEQAQAATRIVQTLGSVAPGGSVFAQAANLADFAQGLATSNGVSLSDEDRIRRIKVRYNAVKKALNDELGPTKREDGKNDEAIQARKWQALADKLRAELDSLDPDMRAAALEAISPPAGVRKLAGLK